MDEKYTVYVRADETGRIVEVNSIAFMADTAGWTAIDENNIPVERSDEEKEAEIANRPAPMSSYNDRVAALEEAMLVMLSRGVSNV